MGSLRMGPAAAPYPLSLPEFLSKARERKKESCSGGERSGAAIGCGENEATTRRRRRRERNGREGEREGGHILGRLNGFLGLSLNDGAILFFDIILERTVLAALGNLALH